MTTQSNTILSTSPPVAVPTTPSNTIFSDHKISNNSQDAPQPTYSKRQEDHQSVPSSNCLEENNHKVLLPPSTPNYSPENKPIILDFDLKKSTHGKKQQTFAENFYEEKIPSLSPTSQTKTSSIQSEATDFKSNEKQSPLALPSKKHRTQFLSNQRNHLL